MKIYLLIRRILLPVPFLLLLLWRLDSIPSLSLWWDEGWSLIVARSWVETGHYGQFLAGQPQPPGLSGSWPVVAPAALGSRLFGTGIWQGRLPIALLSLGALFLLYALARRLFGPTAGWAALFISVLLSPHPLANPIYMGRQVMAEMPMLFYLLAGYMFFVAAGTRPVFLGGAALFWGAALLSKAQLLPFLGAALLGCLLLSSLRRQWRESICFGGVLIGSWLASQALNGLWNLLLKENTLPAKPLEGLTQTVALTLDPLSRQSAFWMVLFTGLPLITALLYESWLFVKLLPGKRLLAWEEWVCLSLLAFCGSWLVWYAVFSIGWARYFMPATFVGSLFVAKAFGDWSGQFSLHYVVQSVGELFLRRMWDRQHFAALWVFLSGLVMSTITIMTLGSILTSPANQDIQRTADFLNTQTPSGALIESYESEILFLLDRPYHYPPDQVSMNVLKKRVDPAFDLGYDPLPAEPDYLVVGGFARGVGLYDAALQSSEFRLIQQFGNYDIYMRSQR